MVLEADPTPAGLLNQRVFLGVSRFADWLNTDESLQGLREAVSRFQSATQRTRHTAFGKLTRDEWHQLALRHAELHVSFVVPAAWIAPLEDLELSDAETAQFKEIRQE